jgi:diguanylate cyclase (GGDEF)-like protein
LFGVVHFENNVFTIGTAMFILALVKERNEAASARAARTDGLTGIANRAAFFENAERVMERCRRDCTPVSVLVFDLDCFKAINDTHGHAVGDDVLRRFCEVLAKALRSSDVFGRIGGEEFAVVLPGSGMEAACVCAERIRASFAKNCRCVADRQIDPTVSCGVSASADAEQPLSVLLVDADIALYRAKAAGRNRVELAFQPEANADSPTLLRAAQCG